MKIFLFGRKIFNILEKECFHNESLCGSQKKAPDEIWCKLAQQFNTKMHLQID